MANLNRREAILLGVSSTAAAATSSQATAQSPNDDVEPGELLEAEANVFAADNRNAVEYWNDVALELNANDHTIEVGQARAPGPVASARALGLIHVVLADAVAHAYPDPLYKPFLYTADLKEKSSSPAAFVGGACAAIISHIYQGAEHETFIRMKRSEFLRRVGLENSDSWHDGQKFGSDPVFKEKWNWTDIWARINNKKYEYKPGPGQHIVDPFNPDQGYYGHSWGIEPKPLALTSDEVTKKIAQGGCAPADPPQIGSPDYDRDAEDVRLVGEMRGGIENPRRTREQIIPGLFWAYDGALFIGTPPRLYNQFVREIARRDKLGPRRLSRLLALCNLAMSDAGNVAWHAKYLHKVWRPVRGLNPGLPKQPKKEDIKWVPHGSPRTNRSDFAFNTPFAGGAELQSSVSVPAAQESAQSLLGGPRKTAEPVPDQRYKEAAFTPNFPAYPSGHATFGTACLVMLRKVRGERLADPEWVGVDRFVSNELDGVAVDNIRPEIRGRRTDEFRDIEKAIDDNNRSRVLLGVHWQFDAEGGKQAGQKVAEIIYGRAYRKA
ncbi:vanadium-dependent haloperoxidase [Mesorhizobium sp. WSM3868]|uniref:vanadium-dependent haloperoxidase n=1 Tax=Mesorhizobium sp. WSM3868 TaxID=2029405 RepID=UPI00117F2F19|nr:vanadium-dependent haloperoxidase [Mesorhizobium sp. WSM3868]